MAKETDPQENNLSKPLWYSKASHLAAVPAGLFFAWWMSFHEIACGCISIRVEVPLPYTYLSCHAYALGCIGAAIALLCFRARLNRFFTPKAIAALCGIGAALTGVFYFYLSSGIYLIAAASQFLLNGSATLILIIGMSLLSSLPFSAIARILFFADVCYVAIDNGVFPLVLSFDGNLVLVAPLQIGLIAGCGFAVYSLSHKVPFDKLHIGKTESDNFAALSIYRWISGNIPERDLGGKSEGNLAFSWPLAFHICTYGIIFGAMHVEASSLISQYFARSIPYSVGAMIALALFYLCFLRKGAKPVLWTKIRDVVFPLTVTSFLLLPFLDSFESYLPVASINCAVSFYLLILLLGMFKVARESRLPFPAIACVGFILYQGSFLIGSMLCQGQLNLLEQDMLHNAGACIVAFLLLMAATIWVGSDNQAEKLWGMRVSLPPKKLALEELHRKCAAIADRYHLTPRESELLELLAHGKKITQIAGELTISVNTARTHSKNMYAKLGVHTQTEAIDLLEQVPMADTPEVSSNLFW